MNSNGQITQALDYSIHDDKKFDKGNYFETEELARKSLIYFALNDPYEYWFPWMGKDTKPSEVPDGAEYLYGGSWLKADGIPIPQYWGCVHRWPKHPNAKA